jgi:uncharacterized protein involved in response to NO
MPEIPLGPTPAKHPLPGWVPFALGFRPFFLLAGVAALALMVQWLLLWVGYPGPVEYYGMVGWHGHEMLFGYAMAVVAGFLLTAVRNWTGINTPSGPPLAGLAALWLAGRVLPVAFPAMPAWPVAVVDLAFIPLLAAALARPLWKGGNKINRVFLPLLLAMALANLLIHLQALGLLQTARLGQDLMVNLLLLLIVLVAGRVMPFFTEKAVPDAAPKSSMGLERGTFGLLLALTVLQLVMPDANLPLALLSAGLALTQALRLWGWHHPGVWRVPILWVLYTGYGWVVLGFTLKALGHLGLFAPNLALHALTLGAFGVLTLGMMSRVALGHTGRLMRSHRAMDAAFVLLNLGALSRVFGPLVLPSYTGAVHLAGGFWLLAFGFFTLIYAPILVRPRADGRPD